MIFLPKPPHDETLMKLLDPTNLLFSWRELEDAARYAAFFNQRYRELLYELFESSDPEQATPELPGVVLKHLNRLDAVIEFQLDIKETA